MIDLDIDVDPTEEIEKEREQRERDREQCMQQQYTRSIPACSFCGGELVATSETWVCSGCAVVAPDDSIVDYGDGSSCANGRGCTVMYLAAAKRVWGTYERVFHLNERFGQLFGAEPPIPHELWELIQVKEKGAWWFRSTYLAPCVHNGAMLYQVC